MSTKQHTALTPFGALRDPYALLRRMTSEMDRMFDEARWPSLRVAPERRGASWFPEIDVFERDNRLVTRVDLPGMKKDDVKVEVTDGHLRISGERKAEVEEKKDHFHFSERAHGSFYRSIPLPDGARLADVKATFAHGVLEVSVPLPVAAEQHVRAVQIEDGAAPAKSAAWAPR